MLIMAHQERLLGGRPRSARPLSGGQTVGSVAAWRVAQIEGAISIQRRAPPWQERLERLVASTRGPSAAAPVHSPCGLTALDHLIPGQAVNVRGAQARVRR